MKKLIVYTFFIFLIGIFTIASIFFSFNINYLKAAEIDYPTQFGEEATKSLPDYINYIYRFGLGSAGFLGVLMLVIGGINLMASTGNPEKMSLAKKRIFGAITGIGLAFFSYFITSMINPNLLGLREPTLITPTARTDPNEVLEKWRRDNPQFSSGGGGSGSSGVTYGSGPIEGSLKIPYIYQHGLGEDWKKRCAYVSTTMVIQFYNPSVTPEQVFETLGRKSTISPQDSQSAIKTLAGKNSTYYEVITNNLQSGLDALAKAEENIKLGHPSLAGTVNPYAATQHVIVIVGFTSDGNVIVHDPNGSHFCDNKQTKIYNPGSPPYLNCNEKERTDGSFLIAPRNELAFALRYVITINP